LILRKLLTKQARQLKVSADHSGVNLDVRVGHRLGRFYPEDFLRPCTFGRKRASDQQ